MLFPAVGVVVALVAIDLEPSQFILQKCEKSF